MSVKILPPKNRVLLFAEVI